MKALVFDKSNTDWDSSRGFELVNIPEPVLGAGDEDKIILKVAYAGVCGTDKGIWNRQAFKDAILNSIDTEISHPSLVLPLKGRESDKGASSVPPPLGGRPGGGGKSYRIIGHEFFGEVKEVGSNVKNIKIGDFVACESHVVCNKCYQCLHGQKNVCINEKILGISVDGGFAEYAKVPAQVVWKTDTSKIRPEVAAMQEPFGNAVHAASKVDVKGKSVAIFGLGPIGLFLTIILKGLGASSIIGIEPNPIAADMARKLGIDYVIPLLRNTKGTKYENEKPYAHDTSVTEEIKKITNGLGVDVAFEMAGFNSSVNNSIASIRRGGDVILFGLKNGDFVLEDYNRLVMKGITLHCVAGRQIWETWETTRELIEDASNGVQEKLFNVILDRGNGTILPISEYNKEKFEEMTQRHPKFLIQF
jgi:threonine 3-dehydrogenase